jgi:hypothetical protein
MWARAFGTGLYSPALQVHRAGLIAAKVRNIRPGHAVTIPRAKIH